MKAITLRNIPAEIAQRLEELSTSLGLSLNKTVLKLLEERLVPEKPAPLGTRRYDDLDHLVGTWTKEEAEEFNRNLFEERQIEPEIWD